MKHWIKAFRLRTLPLAVSSILVGSALAYQHAHMGAVLKVPYFKSSVLWLTLLTAVLLQILSNLANDIGDHLNGADNDDRIGPSRAVQSGAISSATMKRALLICGLLAFASGILLIILALGVNGNMFKFLVIGILAIIAAVKYTYGKNPYGYAGLGDISVFIFFGVVGVIGTYFLQERWLLTELALPAIAMGLLSTGVLNVNNMRDIVNDKASGKHTLVVRMGTSNAKVYHTILVLGGVACLIGYTVHYQRSPLQWVFLPAILIPLFHLIRVWRTEEPRDLDPQLKVLALGTFATALLFSLGLILA